ncbi:MAG TPA: hypothetical protein EYP04_03080 [Anaerolineae bacterium]|nr:hypothetical protein [Anaerolineae bacterium]HIQ04645.1 hypothetical protein [Anaerolineae bacterium]
MYDLIIIGGGPAGLTAAVYTLRKRIEMLLISEDLGGKAHYRMRLKGLEGYEVITGEETIRKFQNQLEYLDFARRIDRAVAVEAVDDGYIVHTAGGETLQSIALLVATGSEPRPLGVPGEKELLGKGVSYSAVSYAPLFWGQKTAVVGNGDLALRAAAELATVADRVMLIAPEGVKSGSPLARKLTTFDNVVLLEHYQVDSIIGGEFVESIAVRSPEGTLETFAVRGVFVELGLVPNSDFIRDLVDTNEVGEIIVDCQGRTSRPGIFAAGDVTATANEQVLIAIGEGAKAALSAYEYLLSHPQPLAYGRTP